MHAAHDTPPAAATGLEIAIVGMAGRFPGAADVTAFWRNISAGVESVTPFTEDELRQRGVPPALLADPAHVRAGVLLDGMDRFDATFFGYTPREAEQLDPQQRLFLECAWEALEHAGCHAARWPGAIGVYGGDGPNLYLLKHLLPAMGVDAGSHIADLLGLMSGNSAGSLCTRVAYKLNLRGPAVSVQTECSTSLVAVHLACQGLLSHDCDMALAGGVWLNLLQGRGYRYQPGAILSPDGHCRAFDARAAGTVIGSGCGLVVLKRLEDALREGDTIHAVIKGSAANNDGADKVGFTAPSVQGQAAVIRAAQVLADVPARSIGYVEAHGTGTPLGDPIEIAALTQAFRADTAERGFCAIGSVKTNIGHLDAAAGVAGLIKAVLALQHGMLPPSLHFEQPNPQIDLANSPLYVNTVLRPWPRGATPRRAGVSSFGIGGTNVHVVLEEAPPPAAAAPAAGWQVLPLSALDDAALREAAQRLSTHLQVPAPDGPVMELADVAYTLQTGRRPFAHRAAVVARDVSGAVEWLSAPASLRAQAVGGAPTEVAFLFPGGGTQHAHMGEALYRVDAAFRDDIDRSCALLQPTLGRDLRTLLFPEPGQAAEAGAQLFGMAMAQPALFVFEHALARWWMRRGVRPAVMLGHSLGEYVAACLAGVFALEDALQLVAARGRLLQTLAPGAMTAVAMAADEIEPFLRTGCDLAAVNGERLCVLSGSIAAIEAAEQTLLASGHLPRRLHVAIASHSAMTEPVLAEMERLVAAVPRQAPAIPFISNVTGLPITAEQAMSPAYWAQHLRGTVRFAEGLQVLLQTPGRALLEVGPGDTLAGLARQHSAAAFAATVQASQAHVQQPARNEQQLTQALAGLWMAGVEIDWEACHAGARRRRVPLPSYPFQRRRHWVEPVGAASASALPKHPAEHPAEHSAERLLYVPGWRKTAPPRPSVGALSAGCVLVLGQVGSLAGCLLQRLQAQGCAVAWVEGGDAFARVGPGCWQVRLGERADWSCLLGEVVAELGPLAGVFHLACLDEAPAAQSPVTPAAWLERGFFSLLALAQALDEAAPVGGTAPLPITVVANQLDDLSGSEPLCPHKATVLGIARVIGQEMPRLSCRVIDVALPAPESTAEARLVQQLVDEARIERVRGDTLLVAYRGLQRWERYYAPRPADEEAGLPPRLRQHGVYLITGGLGAVGLVLAHRLAQHWQARLVLLGRTACPPRDQWPGLLDAEEPTPVSKALLRQLMALEAAGAEVLTVTADVTEPRSMAAALAAAHRRFGRVDGVIHAVVHAQTSALLTQTTRAMVDAVFAPKLRGTDVLFDALQGERLDFVLLCSSLASLAGGMGKAAYAAANGYLDAVAAVARRTAAWPVVSVNWDAWRDIGAAAGMQLPAGLGLMREHGAQVFERIVNGADAAQVIVSTAELGARLALLDPDGLAALAGAAPIAAGTTHPRPLPAASYVAPDNELESGLAALWSEALGLSPIGACDNLFELGGDSLLAIQLLGRVRQAYGVELHPAAFFKAPTVRELAVLVEDRLIADLERAGDAHADAATPPPSSSLVSR